MALHNVIDHLFLKVAFVDFVTRGRYMDKTEHDAQQTESTMSFFSKARGTVAASDRIRYTH